MCIFRLFVDHEGAKIADDVDVAIFYGYGNWPGLRTDRLYAEYLIPVSASALLAGRYPLKNCNI